MRRECVQQPYHLVFLPLMLALSEEPTALSSAVRLPLVSVAVAAAAVAAAAFAPGSTACFLADGEEEEEPMARLAAFLLCVAQYHARNDASVTGPDLVSAFHAARPWSSFVSAGFGSAVRLPLVSDVDDWRNASIVLWWWVLEFGALCV